MVPLEARKRTEAHRQEGDLIAETHQSVGQRLNAAAPRRPVVVDAGDDNDLSGAAVRHGCWRLPRSYNSPESCGFWARFAFGKRLRRAGPIRRCNRWPFEFIIAVHISGWITGTPAGNASTACDSSR